MRCRSAALVCVILLLPVLVAAARAVPAAALSFAAPAFYATGHGPAAVAVADLDGDGVLDVATADSSGDMVSVLLGDGTGGFTAASQFATGSAAGDIAVGDFNGDGKKDLVTANAAADTVSVLLGDGNGAFGPKTDFATGSRPWAVAVGDFNGDGKQDLVTADFGDGAVSVLLGTGSGAFLARTSVVTGPNCNGVAVGDFDADGHADLAVSFYEAMEDSGAGVLLGDGAGHFSAMQTYMTSLEPRALAVGDMDGDGVQDLVTAQGLEDTGEIGMFLGDGAGAFLPGTDVRTSRELFCVTLGDLDGDGSLDVLSAKGAAVIWLKGNGHGGLQKERDFAAGARPWDVASADLNGDGRQDLVTANGADDNIGVRLSGPLTTPVIRGLSPAKGSAAAVVTLTGKHFGAKRGAGAVLFGAVTATQYLRWTDALIKVKVPAGTSSGDLAVVVKTSAGTSAARHFLRL